jgi:hypothetical protein
MTASKSNPVVAENEKPGTLSWLPERLRFTPDVSYGEVAKERDLTYSPFGEYEGDDNAPHRDAGRCALIEGWCSQQSVQAGEVLQIFVSTDPVSEFTLDIYRMGYYQRLGARHMLSVGPFPGVAQPLPTPGEMRLVECDWTPSHEITIPSDWLSGVYLGKLTRVEDGTENYIVFVVRDERNAELIVQTSDYNWQAYNGWPTTYSLYSDGGPSLYYGMDVAASFERPYLPTWSTAIPGTGEFFALEYPFTYWAERMGYDVTYCSNHDTHTGAAALSRAAGFLSIGHDEYWTVEMYHNVRAAIDSGVSAAFLSGNSVCATIGLRPSASGRQDRVLSRIDQFGNAALLARYPEDTPAGAAYRHTPVPGNAPDEGYLMGARNDPPWEGCADWVCSLPDHWIFEGTGMAEGDSIPNLVGHEWHGAPAEDIESLQVVSRGQTYDPTVGPGEYTATVYPGPRGNVVFNAATVWWSSGLSQPPGYQRPSSVWPSAQPDARAQRITENVLSRMIAARS